MAVTIDTPNTHPLSHCDDIWGRLVKVRTRTVTFDSSYDTGGESFTPANVGLSEFLNVFISVDAASTTPGYVVQYDYTDEKLVVYGVEQDADAATTDELDEEDAAVDLTGLTVRVTCIGF